MRAVQPSPPDSPIDRPSFRRFEHPSTLTARLLRANVARGVAIAETLRVQEVPGFATWVEQGVLAEQCGQRIIRRHGEPDTPAWTDHGDGPVVVLLNGWTLSGNVWPAGMIQTLASNHRVFTMDNRGTGGRRGASTPFTLADLADDVAAVIEAADLQQPTIVGFSLGGMIAMELALRHSSLIGALVLLSSRPPNPAQERGTRSLAGAFAGVDRDRPFDEQLIERWSAVAGPGFADRHPERLAEMAESALRERTPWRTVVAQARAVMGWRRPERLSDIDVPTVIAHGDADPLSPVENSRLLARLIPDAQLVELPRVGHLLPQEAPGRVGELIVQHVADLHR